MWQFEAAQIAGGKRFQVMEDDSPLAFESFFERLTADAECADRCSKLLADFDAEAFFLELPALTRASLGNVAEFALIEAPALAGVAPEPGPFSRHFAENPGESVVVFPNLGGDALLVTPAPQGNPDAYAHLATFVRCGPPEQRRDLLKTAASTLLDRLGDAPTWLSTSGLGVHWLHVRLDETPKYYQHGPYRTWRG